MERFLFTLSFIIFQPYTLCVNETGIEVSSNYPVIVDKSENGTEKTPVLRYGFQRTSKCLDYAKAFICIHKCRNLNYDEAHADKHCRCTCYVKKDKAKYIANRSEKLQKIKLPETKIPVWAQRNTDKTKYENVGKEYNLEDVHENETESILTHSTNHENTTDSNKGLELTEHANTTTKMVLDSSDVNITTIT